MQMLYAQGYFQKYLHKMNKPDDDDPMCINGWYRLADASVLDLDFGHTS